MRSSTESRAYNMSQRYSEDAAGSESRPIIVMRNVPCIQALETDLLLYGFSGGSLTHRGEDAVNRVSKELFGVTLTQLDLDDDDEWTDEDVEDEEQEDEGEYIRTVGMMDDEVVKYLKTLGFDFTDARGFPLRCTLHLRCQAEAAAKGIIGRMPDAAVLGTDAWEKSMQADAKAFLDRKRGRTP